MASALLGRVRTAGVLVGAASLAFSAACVHSYIQPRPIAYLKTTPGTRPKTQVKFANIGRGCLDTTDVWFETQGRFPTAG